MVLKSWERALAPDTHSGTAATYLGDIVGAKDVLDGKTSKIEGIKVIDERTLQVTLDGPKAYFLAKLTYPVAFVIDPRQPKDEGSRWMLSPNSTGPYQLKEYKEKEALIFERSETYHTPAIIQYQVFLLTAGGSGLSLFEEGTLDLLDLNYAEMDEIKKPGNPHNKELVTAPVMCTNMLAFNTSLAPTSDPWVRKALALATDQSQWVDKLSSGQALAATSILPPAMPGYQSDRALPVFDPAAAKEALAQSSYAGQTLNIVISASGFASSQRQDVALLTDQWQKNLGVKVTVDLVDPDKYTETVRSKPGNVVISGWCADYPDPENFLDVLFHSGSNFNVTNLDNPALDALLDKARVALDPAERIALYAQAEALILEQTYAIPITNGMNGMLITPRVKGYILTAIGTRILDSVSLKK